MEEKINLDRYESIGVIENSKKTKFLNLDLFKREIETFKKNEIWKREDLLNIFKNTIDEFDHIEKNKFLDDKM